VAVVADEPLDAACHGHIVQGQRAAVPWGERNGDAITAEVDGRLATGNGSVIGHPADEPRRSTEVVEVEGPLDAGYETCTPISPSRACGSGSHA
jgi:hypothetical protein